MNRIRILITTVVLLCFLALPAAATEAAPALSQKTLTLSKGEFQKLELKGAEGYLRWNSADTSVATVTPAGYVTGVKAGTTNISVSYLNQNYTCKVTIEQPKLNVGSKLTLLKGESKQLKVTGTRKKVS